MFDWQTKVWILIAPLIPSTRCLLWLFGIVATDESREGHSVQAIWRDRLGIGQRRA